MFEGYTLEQQRKSEAVRGWRPDFAALTYCTAEAVIFRKPKDAKNFLDEEFLDAERVTGAPDCVGRRQGKWGTYVRPTDPTAHHAIQRGVRETFGWDVGLEKFRMAGIVGPWIHRGTVEISSQKLILTVHEEQGENTPFQAILFWTDVTGFDIRPEEGNYAKTTRGARWIRLRDLIAEQGQNPDYMYWIMLWFCLRQRKLGQILSGLVNDFVPYFASGEYEL